MEEKMAKQGLQLDNNSDGSGDHGYASRYRRPWCYRRSRCEVALGVLVLALGCSIIVLVALLASRKQPEIHDVLNGADDTCFTAECIATASRIVNAMNTSVDPCQDFYQFSCGNWIATRRIPADKGSIQPLSISRDELEEDLQDLLEADIKEEDVEPLKQAKLFYRSCLDEETIDQQGETPLLSFIAEVGGWPVLDDSWDDKTFDLETNLAVVRRHTKNSVWPIPSSAVVSLNVLNDYKVYGKHALYVDQTRTFLYGRESYLGPRNSSVLQAYEDYFRGLAVTLGAAPSRAQTDAASVVDFEVELANISVSLPARRNMEQNYNRMTLKTLQIEFPEFDWLRFVKEAYRDTDVIITEEEPIIMWMPQYFKELFPLLERTSKRTIKNYITFILIDQMATAGNSRLQKLRLQLLKAARGVKEMQPRRKVCADETNRQLSLATGRMYASKRFGQQDKLQVENLIEYLRRSFTTNVQAADWMDLETKTSALQKLATMRSLIGFPPYLFNDSYLTDFYSSYSVTDKDFFTSLKKINEHASRTQLTDLRRPSYDRWPMQPAIVNAFYHNGLNAIVFPAGILRNPYFHRKNPMSMNFGGIGMIIGHEITHGYDATGRSFDDKGLLNDWWSSHSLRNFQARSACVVDHYDNFTYKPLNIQVNGNNTLSENIADIGGTKQSYLAYKEWLLEHGNRDIRLPGLDFSHEQMYFINVAQIWCAKHTTGDARRQIKSGAHSLAMFRVLGELQNSEGFAEVFRCPKSSYMNPEKKCILW